MFQIFEILSLCLFVCAVMNDVSEMDTSEVQKGCPGDALAHQANELLACGDPCSSLARPYPITLSLFLS